MMGSVSAIPKQSYVFQEKSLYVDQLYYRAKSLYFFRLSFLFPVIACLIHSKVKGES